MKSLYDYQKYAVLYVDDERKSLEYFPQALDDKFRIFTADNIDAGYKILEAHQDEIGILLTDQRMPGGMGTELLEKTRKLNPRILRILVTAYSDLNAAITAINSGAIYKYITKPWNIPELQMTLMRGLEFFMLQKERDQLLREKLSALHRIMIADRIVSLGLLASGMQHHVNNAMVAIKTFLTLVPEKLAEDNVDLDHLENPDFWKKFYERVQESVERITLLLSDLWEVSEQRTFHYDDNIRLHEIVDEVIGRLHEQLKGKSIHIKNNISDRLVPLRVDKPKFYRIFELLLKDEIANLPEGSHIILTASPSGASHKHIRIELHDNGPTFSTDALRSVFDPFAVRNGETQEFGVYLMAAYFMVYHHGGTMDFKSDSKKGNTFIIMLPTQPPEVPPFKQNHAFFNDILLNEPLWERVLAEN